MLLIYFLIFTLQNKILSLNIQENAEIELIVFCYENKRPKAYCDSGKSYKNCEIDLQFCASNIYKEKSLFSLQWCNLFERRYKIKNTKGMCKKRLHDTRGVLKTKMNFKGFLQNTTKIYLHISIITEDENRPIPKSLLSCSLNDDVNRRIITMTNEDNISEELIKVRLQRKFTCLENFHGTFCEMYCINPKEISSCEINESNICTKEWYKTNCSHSEFKEKVKQCGPFSGNCKTSKECLNKIKCETSNSSIIKASKYLAEFHSNKTDPYLKFLVKVITIIGGGLLVIIFILLAAVLLMWKVNKKQVIQIYRNSRNHIYRYSFSRQNIPLPTVESNDSNYCNLDSTVDSYILPNRS